MLTVDIYLTDGTIIRGIQIYHRAHLGDSRIIDKNEAVTVLGSKSDTPLYFQNKWLSLEGSVVPFHVSEFDLYERDILEMPFSRMTEARVAELVQQISIRHNSGETELLRADELAEISRLDVPRMASQLPIELGFRVQWYYYESRVRSKKQLLVETQEQIQEYETMYEGDFNHIFGSLTSREADGLDNATDYYDWRDLLEEKEALESLIHAENNQ